MNAAVRDVMSTHVIAVRQMASYKEIAIRLREHRVSAFPVIDADNKVIGVVSETDLLTKEALGGDIPGVLHSMRRHRELTRATAVTAADLMTRPPVTIGPDEPVTHAARLMYNRRVKRLPVTSRDGRLIGIVSRSDVLSVYGRPDAAIHHEITRNLIDGKYPGDPATFTVTVRDGIVTIEGTPETAAAGREIITDLRHIEGVVAVRDRLDYPRRPPSRRASPALADDGRD
ncbi:MAG TPA: CBS domain-containing protein [Trebonia sp.]|nr:CBS domain-containing protein [Trebonia sp.]